MKTLRNLAKLAFALAAFTVLTGARGCSLSTGYSTYDPYPTPPPSGGGTVYTPSPTVYTGDVALTVYAPLGSYVTPDTVAWNVTVREGGAFGPVVLEGTEFAFDAAGVGVVDIAELAYGFYDVEVVGLDRYGNAVSYAATGVTVDEPLVYLNVDLEAVTFSGDVVLEVYEPDGGLYAGPIDTIDYAIWEIDPTSGELVFVEEMFELLYSPWDPPVIGSLELGDYYIEVYAYDAYGYPIYEFAADFTHSEELTVLPVDFWYAP